MLTGYRTPDYRPGPVVPTYNLSYSEGKDGGDHKFKSSLGYIGRPGHVSNKTKPTKLNTDHKH